MKMTLGLLNLGLIKKKNLFLENFPSNFSHSTRLIKNDGGHAALPEAKCEASCSVSISILASGSVRTKLTSGF